jgi:anti-sigma regulatory factor (Ser/Thr protein kinase)
MGGIGSTTLRYLTALPLHAKRDLTRARAVLRSYARSLHLPPHRVVNAITVATELGRNVLEHAGSGEILVALPESYAGILIEARDRGPGIEDVRYAMVDGFYTTDGMGIGLPGAKRLADRFDVWSETEAGTSVCAAFWR